MVYTIILVHHDPGLANQSAAKLQAMGYAVEPFLDPMAALEALESSRSIELLTTNVHFAIGTLSGIALARMALFMRPKIKALFVGEPEFRELSQDLGKFLEMPVTPDDLARSAHRCILSGA